MASTPPQGPVVQVKAQPDIYTILMLVAIIAVAVAVVICGMKLTSPVADGGYGLTVGQLFEPLKALPK